MIAYLSHGHQQSDGLAARIVAPAGGPPRLRLMCALTWSAGRPSFRQNYVALGSPGSAIILADAHATVEETRAVAPGTHRPLLSFLPCPKRYHFAPAVMLGCFPVHHIAPSPQQAGPIVHNAPKV
jgi:hypothetical protein